MERYRDYRDIVSFEKNELEEYLRENGYPAFRSKQIYEWVHKKLASSYEDMSNLPKKLREELAGYYHVLPLEIKEKIVSKFDGTAKYLMATHDGGIIESVAMQYDYGMSVCISSQIGCRMGCKFCASTLLGLERSLTASEMLSQIYNIQRDMGKRVDNIVVMGIGEPFDNYDELIKFIRMVTNKDGLNISQRNITVSTCGLVDRIYKFADEELSVTLAISLHASNDEIRRKTMPVANKYSIKEIIDACRYFVDKPGRRVTFEYTMIAGVNDSRECADELSALLKGLLCHVNLIPLNAVKEREHRCAERENIERFKRLLENNGVNSTIRKGMGKDIEAACGQLRRKYVSGQTV